MISDNNHITYSAEDIQRYWNGQLSPQEMHAMEKAALDDPFLADAMEGIGDALQEHDEKMVTAELNNLRQQVQTRTNTTPVRSIRWWKLAAAALVVLTIGYWVVSMNGSASKENLALQESSDETRAMVPDAIHDSSTIPAGEKTADSPSPAPATTPDTVSGLTKSISIDRVKAPEPGYYNFNTNPKKDSLNSLSLSNSERRSLPLPPIDLKNENKDQPAVVKTIPAAQNNFDSVGKVETEVVKLPQGSLADADKTTLKKSESEPRLYNVVSGIVTDNKNNPLPNVFLRLDNTKSYTTDPLGNFKIPITDSVARVWVSLPGYATQNFVLRSTHDGTGNLADNKIRLQPSSELAARQGSAYYNKKAKGKADDSEDFLKGVAFQNAQPANGWLTYEQYLEKNKKIPGSNPNLTGEVAVSFVVNKKGELSNFKVDKSLSAQHDAEALRLVKEGPAWKLVKGRKSRVTVIVRF